MDNNGVVIEFDIYGFLAGPLLEMYENKTLFTKETIPAFLKQKLIEYIPFPSKKNIRLKKPLYLAFFENEIKSLQEIAKATDIKLAIMLAARARMYYDIFTKHAAKENVNLARVRMQFKIPDNMESNMYYFLKPASEIIISIINPLDDSYFMTVKIEDWTAPRLFSDLLANA